VKETSERNPWIADCQWRRTLRAWNRIFSLEQPAGHIELLALTTPRILFRATFTQQSSSVIRMNYSSRKIVILADAGVGLLVARAALPVV
jgi:hypothetical protein